MKLTKEQIQLRKEFRYTLLNMWGKGCNLGIVVAHVNDKFGRDVIAELDAIPSISRLSLKFSCDTWLASHFPKTSNAMFDGKSIDKALKIWKEEKRINKVSALKIPKSEAVREIKKSIATRKLFAIVGDNKDSAWNKNKGSNRIKRVR